MLLCTGGSPACVDALRELIVPTTDVAVADTAPEVLADTGSDLADTQSDGVQPVCVTHEDCTHLQGCCTTGYCYQGTCQLAGLADCCSVEGSCAVSSVHYSGVCETPCGEGSCIKSLVLPEDVAECADPPLYRFDPDVDSVGSLTVVDSNPEDTVSWHISARRGLSGGRALYAGDITCPSYHTGPFDAACEPLVPEVASAIELQLQTPPTALPGDRPAVLRMWLWSSVEDGGSTTPSFDGLEVGIRRTDAAYTRSVWSSQQAALPQGQWVPVLVDLALETGAEVSIWLTFATGDGVDNDHEGIYIGALEVLVPCAGDRSCVPPDACGMASETPVHGLADKLCTYANAPPGLACQACDTPAECTSTEACDTASCSDGRCQLVHELTAECCTADEAWTSTASFEEPDLDLSELQWTFEPPLEVSDPIRGLWHVTTTRAFDGGSSLRFGVPGAARMAPAGATASQIVWAPQVRVPAELPVLEFRLWLSTEWDQLPSTSNPAGVDRFSVWLRRPGSALAPTEIWSGDSIGGSTQGVWSNVVVVLDAFAGLDVELGFRFQTGDEAANDYEGACLDSIRVVRLCPAAGQPEPTATSTP